MKPVLLFGSSGYVGSVFRREMDRRGIPYVRVARSHVFTRFDVSLVINCAAYVAKPSVDFCEDNKVETLRGNLLLPAVLSDFSRWLECPFLHVSTGCLYNGDNGGKGWSEKDPAQLTFDTGAGIYVSSKQMAEEVVAKNEHAYICRIRIPFDEEDGERNYISKMLRYPKIYEDLNSLSHRGDFVNACLDLWMASAPFGTYNVTNPGAMWTHDVVDAIRRHLKPEGQFVYWDHDEFHQKVARTKKSNCVLDVSKLLSTGVKIRPVHEAVEDSLKNWKWETKC